MKETRLFTVHDEFRMSEEAVKSEKKNISTGTAENIRCNPLTVIITKF